MVCKMLHQLLLLCHIMVISPFCPSLSFPYDNCRQDIANHLLERLEDEEIAIRKQTSTLLPMIGLFTV